jgi:NSS family neurotransmitter:Na+ symporter
MNSFDQYSGPEAQNAFDLLLASPGRLLLFQALFIATGVVVVARGVGKGIETVTRYMMPALFAILVILVIYAIFNADIARGIDFLFNPRFNEMTANGMFMALGQAFFSLAIGVGVMLTYGAYVPANISLPKAAFMVALADTSVSVLAGIAIFPVVFANDLDPAGGAGLIFVTLPIAFGNMPFGYLVGFLFFVLLFFAAYTSVIAMLEPIVSYLEENHGMSRPKLTVMVGLGSLLLGIAASLSFNVWSEVRLLGAIPYFADKDIFSLLDFSIANFLLPLNALLIAVFAGWIMTRESLLGELGVRDESLRLVLQIVLRYVAPVLIAMIFYNSIAG